MSTTTLAYIGAIGAGFSLIVAIASALYTRTSARAARDAVDHEKSAYWKANAAKVVRHEPFGFAHDGTTVRFVLRMYNEGPAVAKNLRFTIPLPGYDAQDEERTAHFKVSSETLYSLQPHQEESVLVQIPKTFDGIGGWLKCDLTYEDGNGPHQQRYWIRTQGNWETRWVQHVQDHEPTGEES